MLKLINVFKTYVHNALAKNAILALFFLREKKEKNTTELLIKLEKYE